jgi:PAS domain S-box-containing protein
MPQDLLTRLTAIRAEATRLARGGTEPLTILQRLLDAEPVAALVADDGGRYVMANYAASVLTGYAPDVLCHLSVWELTPNLNEREAVTLWRAFLAVEEQYGEYALLVHGGRVVRVAYAAQANIFLGLHVSLLRPI